MRIIHFSFMVALLGLQPSVLAQPLSQQNQSNRIAKATVVLFEPLDRWKMAVEKGDRAILASLYTTSPLARAKIPQGETQDPDEEPAFWSSLRKLGISRVDPKVLEVKNVQPGVKALVLRIELVFRTPNGEKTGIVSAVQVWLQQKGEWRIASTQRSDLAAMPAMRLPEPTKPNSDLYPPPEEAVIEIAAALKASARDHKRVLLVFGGNWCYDCHVLESAFRSRAILPLITANYHVVHVNVGDYDKNIDLAKKYDIPLDKGVPSLAILDQTGKLIVSQKQGEFESTARLGPEDVVQFLKQWKPPQANSKN